MKRSTIVVILTIIGLLTMPFAAAAQTAPPGGSPPGSMPYCNAYGYAIPQPYIGGNIPPATSSSLPATVQASEINRATTAIAYEVWKVAEKINDGHWRIEFVGYTTTPAMMGICATPGTNAEHTTSTDIPDIVFDPDMPSQAATGPSFYRECQKVFDHLNRELSDFGYTSLTIAGGCVMFLYYSAKATCITFGPAVALFLRGQAEHYYAQNMPIVGGAFEGAWHRFNTALYMWCSTVGVAKANPSGVYA